MGWLETSLLSPKTQLKLTCKNLIPNYALRAMIGDYKDNRDKKKRDEERKQKQADKEEEKKAEEAARKEAEEREKARQQQIAAGKEKPVRQNHATKKQIRKPPPPPPRRGSKKTVTVPPPPPSPKSTPRAKPQPAAASRSNVPAVPRVKSKFMKHICVGGAHGPGGLRGLYNYRDTKFGRPRWQERGCSWCINIEETDSNTWLIVNGNHPVYSGEGAWPWEVEDWKSKHPDNLQYSQPPEASSVNLQCCGKLTCAECSLETLRMCGAGEDEFLKLLDTNGKQLVKLAIKSIYVGIVTRRRGRTITSRMNQKNSLNEIPIEPDQDCVRKCSKTGAFIPATQEGILDDLKKAIKTMIPEKHFHIIERWLRYDYKYRMGRKDILETRLSQIKTREMSISRRLAASAKTRDDTIGKLLAGITIAFVLLPLLAGAIYLRHRLRCKRRRPAVTELQRVVIRA